MSTKNNVSFQSLVNATVVANNTSDTSRQYGITAEILINGDNVEQVNNGQVTLIDAGMNVASFNESYGNFTITFFNNLEIEKRVTIITAVSSFIAEAKDKVSQSGVVSL